MFKVLILKETIHSSLINNQSIDQVIANSHLDISLAGVVIKLKDDGITIVDVGNDLPILF